MQISQRIFEILSERGMTQKEFSAKTGIKESTISDWKHKKVNPSADKIMIVCDVLEVSPYTLLAGTDEKYNPMDYELMDKKSSEYQMIETFRNLSEGQKNRVLGYMNALTDIGEKL